MSIRWEGSHIGIFHDGVNGSRPGAQGSSRKTSTATVPVSGQILPPGILYVRLYVAQAGSSGHGVASPPPSQGAPDWAGRSRRAWR